MITLSLEIMLPVEHLEPLLISLLAYSGVDERIWAIASLMDPTRELSRTQLATMLQRLGMA